MATHFLLERLFENSTAEKGLLCPFNRSEVDDADTNSKRFEESFYRLCLPPGAQKEIKYLNLVERAMVRLCMPEIEKDLVGFGGYGFDAEGNFYADYYDGVATEFNSLREKGEKDFTKHRHILVKIDTEKRMSGSILDPYGGNKPYLIRRRADTATNRHSSSAAIYALIAYAIASFREKRNLSAVAGILSGNLNSVIDSFVAGDYKAFGEWMRVMDVNIYTLLQYPNEMRSRFGDLPFPVEEYSKCDLDVINPSEIKEVPIPYGSSAILGASAVKETKKGKTQTKSSSVLRLKDYLDGSLSLGMKLSEEEKNLVPASLDEYVPSEIILDVAREIKASISDKIPARNFLFTGETGTGKTTETRMLARLLNLPYRSMNLSSDKLSSDILQLCLPNPKRVSESALRKMITDFPDSEEVAVNPCAAYRTLTGKEKPDATQADVRDLEIEKILGLTKDIGDFMYVDSPFVETYRHGGVVEMQECNAAKAAVLKSLNETMDDLNLIHLPTGEIVHRHPNAIIVVTANVGQGYEGINAFSNDFLARFHQADVFELPSDEALGQRVMEQSGFGDQKTVAKMVKVMHAIQRVLLETKGDYGSCSTRGLIAWARKTKNTGNAYSSALKTIVGLSTQDPEIRVELLHALETEFVPMGV